MTDEPKTDEPKTDELKIDEPKTGNTGLADVVAEAPPAAAAAQLKIEHGSAIPADELARLSGEILEALKTVYDPEIPADIYELGLIYKVDVDDDRVVKVEMISDHAELPLGGGIAGDGGECGGKRAGRARGQGRHRLGSAMGSEPDVGRGPRRAQYVVSCAQALGFLR